MTITLRNKQGKEWSFECDGGTITDEDLRQLTMNNEVFDALNLAEWEPTMDEIFSAEHDFARNRS